MQGQTSSYMLKKFRSLNQNLRRYLDDRQFDWTAIISFPLLVISRSYHRSIHQCHCHCHHDLFSIIVLFSWADFTITRYQLSLLHSLSLNQSSHLFIFSYSSFSFSSKSLLPYSRIPLSVPSLYNLMIYGCTRIFSFTSALASAATLFLLSNLLSPLLKAA